MNDLKDENATRKDGMTWNGAVSNSAVGGVNEKYARCLEYFSKCGTYNGRSQAAVDKDMEAIFQDDRETALKVIFGLRLITRKPNRPEGIEPPTCPEEVATGMGRRDEFYKCLVWLAANDAELLRHNIDLVPVFGSWKDLLQPPLLTAVNRTLLTSLVAVSLDEALLLKYLPTMRSFKKARSERDKARIGFAKDLCAFCGFSEKDYRKLKSAGPAHIWQRMMQQKKWDLIDFSKIPGKALMNAISQKGKQDKKSWIERHGRFEDFGVWLEKQRRVKFTGQPYELCRAAERSENMIQNMLYDKQWETCLESLKGHCLGDVLVGLDTSASMGWCELIKGVRPIDVCLSLGVAFSMLNTGICKDAVAMFSDTSTVVKLAGTFTQRLRQIKSLPTAMGSTNFQSLIDAVCRVRAKNPSAPIEAFPSTLLVVSDMQFNPASTPARSYHNAQTNYEEARQKLAACGLPGMRIIWWHVNGAKTTDFPCLATDKGCFLVSGFDPSILKGLLRGEETKTQQEKKDQTPLDGMMNFLSQPIFKLLRFTEKAKKQEVEFPF